MQTKISLFASALSIFSIVSAQSDSAASQSDEVRTLSSLVDYITSAAANPSFTSAIGAVTVSPEVISSQGEAYLSSAATVTASLPLPSFVKDQPSSIQGPISSYYVGVGSVISSLAKTSPSGSMTTSASGSSTGASSSVSSGGSSSTSGSSTTPAPSKSSSSGSSSATSPSASAKASNGAVAQHPGPFMAAAAGALGFAALL